MNLRLRNGTLSAAMLVAVCATCVGQAAAATIVAPDTAFATSNFGPTRNDYSIENTIDQSGLIRKYVSGVTGLEGYLALAPRHTSNANGNEWFSEDFSKSSQSLSSQSTRQILQGGKTKGQAQKSNASRKIQQVSGFRSVSSNRSAGKPGKKRKLSKNNTISVNNSIITTTSSALASITSTPLVTIIYEFSALTTINGFVLWNEEYAGIGITQLLSSVNGLDYTLLSTITPEPSKFAQPRELVPYLAQVFSFDPTLMLYFKLLIYDCPKPSANRDSYRGCGIGEVAFSALPRGPGQSPVVPVPAALPLLASALGLFAWLGRRQQNRN